LSADRPRGRSRRVAVGAALLVALAACSGSADSSAGAPKPTPTTGAAHPVPGREWQHVAPEAVGLDPDALEAIADEAESARSRCLVVVRDGKIAGEWYFAGTDASTTQEVFSATKSFASTLVGLAQDDGDLEITDPASKWISEWRGTPSEAVTVRDLLSNDSGRQWSLQQDYVELIQAADKTRFAVDLGQAEDPGTVWAYNNSAIQTLQRVVGEATGEDASDFARMRLFEPLGMRATEMKRDAAGNTMMFMGVQSNCRDLARFGLLMLDHGRWGTEQIVSADWVRAATGASSTDLNAAYGYLWWLNREGVLAGPTAATSIDGVRDGTVDRGRLVPGAPADMFWALGLGNQIIQIDPGSRTVVVRLGPAEASPQPPTFDRASASRVVTEAVVGEAGPGGAATAKSTGGG